MEEASKGKTLTRVSISPLRPSQMDQRLRKMVWQWVAELRTISCLLLLRLLDELKS